jgi:hypothetical protein
LHNLFAYGAGRARGDKGGAHQAQQRAHQGKDHGPQLSRGAGRGCQQDAQVDAANGQQYHADQPEDKFDAHNQLLIRAKK